MKVKKRHIKSYRSYLRYQFKKNWFNLDCSKPYYRDECLSISNGGIGIEIKSSTGS